MEVNIVQFYEQLSFCNGLSFDNIELNDLTRDFSFKSTISEAMIVPVAKIVLSKFSDLTT